LLRRAFVALAIGLLAVGSAACQPRPASAPRNAAATSSAEPAQLVTLINNFRAANGMAGLAVANDATWKAQQHADQMAGALTIFHSSDLAAGLQPGWRGVGENVGVAYSLGQVESLLEASAPHRANLLNGLYNQVGVGVAHGSDGRIYVTEIFVGR
jgi:uncharacterized protein YkwD